MKPALLASCLAIIVVAQGCTPAPKKARFTVEHYLADRELMNRTVAECANNPGELRDDPDCVNAKAAAQTAGQKTLRELEDRKSVV